MVSIVYIDGQVIVMPDCYYIRWASQCAIYKIYELFKVHRFSINFLESRAQEVRHRRVTTHFTVLVSVTMTQTLPLWVLSHNLQNWIIASGHFVIVSSYIHCISIFNVFWKENYLPIFTFALNSYDINNRNSVKFMRP